MSIRRQAWIKTYLDERLRNADLTLSHHLTSFGRHRNCGKSWKWILVIVLLYSEEKPLKSGWMDVQVLYQAQLIVHALQQGQELEVQVHYLA